MTSSRSHYGVVVVVDRQGRHLHCDAWVSVTFRINIGGGTNHAVECLTTKPSEDGVYYFNTRTKETQWERPEGGGLSAENEVDVSDISSRS